jgi:hypothetical protein
MPHCLMGTGFPSGVMKVFWNCKMVMSEQLVNILYINNGNFHLYFITMKNTFS